MRFTEPGPLVPLDHDDWRMERKGPVPARRPHRGKQGVARDIEVNF